MRLALRLQVEVSATAGQLDFLEMLIPPQRPDRPLTLAMIRALVAAAARPNGAILPVAGLNPAAAQALAGALLRRGVARQDGGTVLVINGSGRAAVAAEGG
jgi:hypothetical protein